MLNKKRKISIILTPFISFVIIFSTLMYRDYKKKINENEKSEMGVQQNNSIITEIEWKSQSYDFGDIDEGETVSHNFYLTNKGQKPLIIKNVETGCNCTKVVYDKKPLAPGNQLKFEIIFESKARIGKQYKEITIFANIKEKETKLKFSAFIKQDFY